MTVRILMMHALRSPERVSKLAAVRFMVRWLSLGYVVSLLVIAIGTGKAILEGPNRTGDYLYFPIAVFAVLAWCVMAANPCSDRVKWAMGPIAMLAITRLVEVMFTQANQPSIFGRFNGITLIGIWMTLIWSLVIVTVLTEYHVQLRGSRLDG